MISTALLVVVTSLVSSAAQSLPSPWVTGIATNYGGAQDGMDPSSPSFGTKDGSCGYGLLSTTVYPYWSVGALSTSNQFSVTGPSNGCGQCFEVKCMNSGGQFAGRCGSAQSITITITDSCPECGANHLDIQALTFNKIAPMAIGRIDIQYRRVDCTPQLPVSIAIDNNVGVGGWLRLVVEKTAGFGGITAVSIQGAGSTWNPMNNKFGSAWEVGNTPALPWSFRFTSDAGQTIVAQNLVSSGGVIGSIPTGVQFSLSGSTGQQAVSFDSSAVGGATPPAAAGAAPAGGAATPPAASTSIAATNQAGGCPCADVQPTQTITCAQQKAYGKCQDSWMTAGNFCQQTCGNCPPACSGGSPGAPATPPSSSTSTTGAPPANLSTPAQPGSVQTQSIAAAPPLTAGALPPPSALGGAISPPTTLGGAIPPPATLLAAGAGSTPPAAGAGQGCEDVPPANGSCSSLAPASCSNADLLPVGKCDKSCYRCTSTG